MVAVGFVVGVVVLVGFGVGVAVVVAVVVAVGFVVLVGVAVVVAVVVAVGFVVGFVVGVAVAVGFVVGVAVVTAAIYIPKATRFHADVHCEAHLARRGVVGEADLLRRRKMIPCRKCWKEFGYEVQPLPEMWEVQ